MAQHWSLKFQQDLGFGCTGGYVVISIISSPKACPVAAQRKRQDLGRPLSPVLRRVYSGRLSAVELQGMQITVSAIYQRGFGSNANYKWSHAIDDVAGFFRITKPDDINADVRAAIRTPPLISV